MHPTTMRTRALRRDASGFTLVEVLAAMAVLLIGLVGTLKVVDGVAATSATAQLREQGVALQRELLEAARSVRYSDLGPGTTVPRLQALPGLADDDAAAPGWQLRRRGVVYDVAAGACTVDDPRDGTGPHDATTFCATGTGTTAQSTCAALLGSGGAIQGVGNPTGPAVGDCGLDTDLDGEVDELHGGASGTGPDANANDAKRLVVLVRWRNGGGSRYVLQDATVPHPGAADGVQVTALSAAPSPVGAATAEVQAAATTDRIASTVAWSVDGELGDAARMTGSGTTWAFRWALGTVTPRAPGAVPGPSEVVDGTYVLSARAYDGLGAEGTDRAEAVVVDRRAPFSVPSQLLRNDGSSVVVAWTPSRERDLTGYRVVRERPGEPATVVCTVVRGRSCRDGAPPPGPASFWVVATDARGEGDPPAAKLATTVGGTPPAAPVAPGATRAGGQVTVTWQAGPGGATSFRVYRDGVALTDLAATATGTSWTDAEAAGAAHEYYVSAVDARGVESAPAGPVRA